MDPLYVPITQASKLTGIGRNHLVRLIEDGILPAYRAPGHARKRLLKVADLGKIPQPVPPTPYSQQDLKAMLRAATEEVRQRNREREQHRENEEEE